jgi:hypothetical protein
MRALASKRVLKHRRDGRFALTSIGQALRSDVPGSVRDMILIVGHPSHWKVWRNPPHSVRTGEPAPKGSAACRSLTTWTPTPNWRPSATTP